MKRLCMSAVFGLLSSVVPISHADCVGSGDLNADGAVNSADLPVFASCMSGPQGPSPGTCEPQYSARADLDGDGDVDLADAASLTSRAGQTYFVYGPHRENLEAEMLAMALTGQLRAPEQEYQRIRRDLALIRAAYPVLATVIDDPNYMPDQLIVELNPAVPADAYRTLNAYYLVVAEQRLVGNLWRLTFCDNLNAEVLDDIYNALLEVTYAAPTRPLGTDDQITVDAYWLFWRYRIDDGFGDCMAGCPCHREWILDVNAQGAVTLVSYREWGAPSCQF